MGRIRVGEGAAARRGVCGDRVSPQGPFGILRLRSNNNCGGSSCDIVCAGQGTSQRQYNVLPDAEGAQTTRGLRKDLSEYPG